MTPDRLREVLAILQWTQRGFARVLNRSEGTIRQWARGAVKTPDDVAEWLETCIRTMPPPRSDYVARTEESRWAMYQKNALGKGD